MDTDIEILKELNLTSASMSSWQARRILSGIAGVSSLYSGERFASSLADEIASFTAK